MDRKNLLFELKINHQIAMAEHSYLIQYLEQTKIQDVEIED